MLGLNVSKWKNSLAKGHTETWLATVITLWAIGVIIFVWYLVSISGKHKSVKYILAATLLYEVLP